MSLSPAGASRPEVPALLPEHARLLYAFNAWANSRVLDACAALTPEQFARDLGSSFPSVRDTLAHILRGSSFWLDRWRGQSPPVPPRSETSQDLAALRAYTQKIDAELQAYVAEFSADDLARVIHYRTTEGKDNFQPFWQMLQHLANHGSYHRGQITTMLRQLGASAVATDLIAFYRERGEAGFAPPISPATARLLYDYNAWANRRVFDSCAALTPEQFTRDLGSSFPSVRDTLTHIVWAEWVWLERWHGRSPSGPPAGEPLDLPALRARWDDIERDRNAWLAGHTPADLARVHEFRTTKGVLYPNALWQALQHVVNHGTYHRGQVATLLCQLGAKPHFTDLIYFYRERAGQALD